MKRTRQEIEKQIHTFKNNLRKVNYQKKQLEFKIKALEKGLSHITLEEIPVNKTVYEFLKYKKLENCKDVYDYYCSSDTPLVVMQEEACNFIATNEDDKLLSSRYVHDKATALLSSIDSLCISINILLNGKEKERDDAYYINK